MQKAGSARANLTVDYRLWSAQRIAAYQNSLVQQLAPPLAVLRAPRLGLEALARRNSENQAILPSQVIGIASFEYLRTLPWETP